MPPYDLSVCIPARHEEFLGRTIEDILEHSGPRTEVIAALDGEWPVEPLPQHERVSVLYLPQSIGQRAATNAAARVSEARWVMKCDAHCSFGMGFDEELMAAMEGNDDWTIVPKMYNLHAFDWVCRECGWRKYQGPTPESCGSCGASPVEREMLWRAKPSPETTSMRFDRQLHFQYWGGYKARQHGDLVETMSLLGACWMLTRERYWALDICDEEHGGWGQQGTEVACKTWLSGGRLIVDRRTWFAHMFRTQGGDFGFPYPLSGSDVSRARKHSRKLWLEDGWPLAVRPLSWLIEHFAPVPDWEGETASKGVVFYTDHRVPVKLAHTIQKGIRDAGLPIWSASLKPMSLGTNVLVEGERGVLTMFRQILAGLEACDTETVFFCEHDVLYHPSHFEFVPPRGDRVYYNVNVWKVRVDDGFCVRVDDCRQTSGLCANRELLVEHYRERVRRVEAEGFSRRMGFEPGTHGRAERVDDLTSEVWSSEYPNLDLRLPGALTESRWSPAQYRNPRFAKGWTEATVAEIEGWEGVADLLTQVAVKLRPPDLVPG